MQPTRSRFLNRERVGTLEATNRAVDLVGLALAAIVTARLYPLSTDNIRSWMLLALFSGALTLLIFQQNDLYRSWRGKPFSDQFSRLVLGAAAVSLIILLTWKALGLEAHIPIVVLLTWQAIAAALVVGQRTVVHLIFRSLRVGGSNLKNVIICGAGPLGLAISRQAAKSPETGFCVVGFLDDQVTPPQTPNREPVLGSLADLGGCLKNQRIDEVWIALPLSAMTRVEEIVLVAEQNMICVRLFPDIYSFNLLNHSTSELLGFPIIDLNVSPIQGFNLFLKEAEDRILGTLLFILSLPLLALIALTIKATSDGPVIFRQRRHGKDWCKFTIYKFRTMVAETKSDGEFMQAQKNDSRFTTFGRWLRRTSLDELPQLFNVLQGKMSLVGPRPHAVEHDELFQEKIPGYLRRNRVKPGITGWAQVNDLRGEVKDLDDMVQRVKHDLYYIEHWSLWFDLRILIATVVKIFVSKKAW